MSTKVLVVEDQEAVRRFIGDLILRTNPDVSVVLASSVSEAFSAIEDSETFDVLLTDFDLGDGTGNDVAAKFAAKFPKASMFGMSGNPNSAFNPQHFTVILSKPFGETEKAALTDICS